MRHQTHGHRLRCLPAFLALMLAWTLVGCSSGGNTQVSVGGTVALSTANASAVGGLVFRFADGAILGFAGEDLTLGFGEEGTTFTLTTSRGTVVVGTMTFGSCTFTETPAVLAPAGRPLFVQTYATCQVSGSSNDDIGFGGSGNGTLLLRLGRDSGAIVNSAPLSVVYHVDAGGQITINLNTTPIGVTG